MIFNLLMALFENLRFFAFPPDTFFHNEKWNELNFVENYNIFQNEIIENKKES